MPRAKTKLSKLSGLPLARVKGTPLDYPEMGPVLLFDACKELTNSALRIWIILNVKTNHALFLDVNQLAAFAEIGRKFTMVLVSELQDKGYARLVRVPKRRTPFVKLLRRGQLQRSDYWVRP